MVVKAPAFAKDIDEDLIKLCDEAIENLGKTSPVAVSGDLFFGNNAGRWRNFARAVKLKLLFEANALTSFTFKYTSLASPEGHYPWFQSAYLSDNTFPHISHQLMIKLIADKAPGCLSTLNGRPPKY